MTYYPPVVAVTLYLSGDMLDPDAVTQATGIAPTHSQKKGEAHITCSGKTVIRKLGVWAWEPGLRGQSVDLQMAALVRCFTSVPVRLRDLPGVEEAYVDLYSAYAPDGDNAGGEAWTLREPHLQLLAAHGLEFRATISCDSE